MHFRDDEVRWENFGLTPRELEVVSALAKGYTNQEIAERIGLSQRTVKHHIFLVLDKLGVASRIELIQLLLRGYNGSKTRRTGS